MILLPLRGWALGPRRSFLAPRFGAHSASPTRSEIAHALADDRIVSRLKGLKNWGTDADRSVPQIKQII